MKIAFYLYCNKALFWASGKYKNFPAKKDKNIYSLIKTTKKNFIYKWINFFIFLKTRKIKLLALQFDYNFHGRQMGKTTFLRSIFVDFCTKKGMLKL